MSVIRGTSLIGYPALVRELGADPETLLSRAGITRSDVGRFEAEFLRLLHANHGDVLAEIKNTGVLSDATQAKLRQILDGFAKSFA